MSNAKTGFVEWTTKSGKVYSVPVEHKDCSSLSEVMRRMYKVTPTYYGVAKILSQGKSFCAPQMVRNIILQGK